VHGGDARGRTAACVRETCITPASSSSLRWLSVTTRRQSWKPWGRPRFEMQCAMDASKKQQMRRRSRGVSTEQEDHEGRASRGRGGVPLATTAETAWPGVC
jgi:hypothetical protein